MMGGWSLDRAFHIITEYMMILATVVVMFTTVQDSVLTMLTAVAQCVKTQTLGQLMHYRIRYEPAMKLFSCV